MSAFCEMHEDDMQEWLNEMAEAEFDAITGRNDVRVVGGETSE